jgi:hypothetical protein
MGSGSESGGMSKWEVMVKVADNLEWWWVKEVSSAQGW